jgi:hypothetical protein
MLPVLKFDEAIARCSADKRSPHVLLGNGFSRALRNDIFAYDAILSRADFSSLSPLARMTFDALRTTDFEVAIRALRTAATLARLYAATYPDLALQMDRDADGLREVLVRTIATHHPEQPAEIRDDQYAACRTFLAQFGRIYTFNYDLLLYWALMHDEVGPDVACDDGFRTSTDHPDADYVTWDIEKTDAQNIFYLHGGLHIFDAATELLKYTWSRTGIRLIEQIRDALDRHLYPVFVSEGESDQKLERIRHNDMLSRSYRSFAKITGALFIYGHSLAANDEHFLKVIERGKLDRIYVSIYGDPSSADNRRIIARAEALASARPPRKPLDVTFYDAASAQVWG